MANRRLLCVPFAILLVSMPVIANKKKYSLPSGVLPVVNQTLQSLVDASGGEARANPSAVGPYH
jgi:hypothetical protein